ncbi:uncharacterized protein [Dermacentor albipictus]|uniref:uncharacterized protein n=1 Tax=Dermacentor albipictus TaxID=60249 RepID=UPI0038FCC175
MTPVLQALDVSVNKPFEANLRQEYEEWDNNNNRRGPQAFVAGRFVCAGGGAAYSALVVVLAVLVMGLASHRVVVPGRGSVDYSRLRFNFAEESADGFEGRDWSPTAQADVTKEADGALAIRRRSRGRTARWLQSKRRSRVLQTAGRPAQQEAHLRLRHRSDRELLQRRPFRCTKTSRSSGMACTVLPHSRQLGKGAHGGTRRGTTLCVDSQKFRSSAEVRYMGHILTTQGLRIDPEHVQDILEISEPKTNDMKLKTNDQEKDVFPIVNESSVHVAGEQGGLLYETKDGLHVSVLFVSEATGAESSQQNSSQVAMAPAADIPTTSLPADNFELALTHPGTSAGTELLPDAEREV